MIKKILKISCILLVSVIIFTIYDFYYEWKGSPTLKIKMSKNAEEYIEKTYPNMDISLDYPVLDMQCHLYFVRCKSKSNPDLDFEICFSEKGNLLYDTNDSEYDE